MPVTDAPVLVTGAAGFVASRIVQLLLARGYRVRGTVRSLEKTAELAPVRVLPGATQRLQLVEADLLKEGSFDAAALGCTHVVHSASPYILTPRDPQKELIDPAVKGTRNVLSAAARAGTVKRVVLTSSVAAITDEPGGERVLSEEDWNVRSTLHRNPYYLSKTLAEKAGWDFVTNQHPGFDLIAINPFLVVGPSLVPSLNTSNQIVADLLKGVYPGVIGLAWGFVDVRDVAEAHVRALETPSAHGRYLCAGECVTMRALVAMMARLGWKKGHKLPSMSLDGPLGNRLVHVLSYLQPKGVGTYLRTHLGRVPRYDNGKIQRELGLTFRSAETSVADTLADLARWGHIQPRAA
jgi:dihydroflavonol-4-reductase